MILHSYVKLPEGNPRKNGDSPASKKKICGFKAQLWKKNDFEASMEI